MLTSPLLLERFGPTDRASDGNSLSQLGEDYDRFLTLLTAQVQNQDPLAPVESTEFVAQLAQLSQVEQAVQTNQQIETLNSLVTGLMNLNGTQLIGQEVKTLSNTVELRNGTIASAFTVGNGAVQVEARYFDPLGRLVRTQKGLSTEAFTETPLSWNGFDDNGVQQLEGFYTVQVIAKDAQGDPIDTEVSRIAQVQEVIFQEGEILFRLQGGETVSSVTVLSAS